MVFSNWIISTKRRWVPALGLLLAVGVVGALAVPVSVPAAPRQTTSPQHFKSGGERSAIILGEIRDTLKQIDSRLQRIEQAVLTAASKEPNMQRVQPSGAR